MKRTVIIIFFIALIVLGAFFGYRWHQQNTIIETLIPHIKNASLRTSNAINLETSESSKVTYKEWFEKLEADISDIDKRLLDVQTMSTPAIKTKNDTIVSYLKACQELLRTLLLKARKQLQMTSTFKWAENSITQYYNRSSAEQAIKEFQKTQKEFEESKSDIITSAKKLGEARTQVASVVSKENLIDTAELDKLVKLFSKKD